MLKYGKQMGQFYIFQRESDIEYINEFNIESRQTESMVLYNLWKATRGTVW